jgi:two-component system alkaline phosphatase synthesis response regulator PhoP
MKNRDQKKVLAVDDEAFVLRIIEDKLESANIAVLTAKNGQEAIEIAKKNQPHLILLDWMLPDIDGLTVLKILKKQPQTTNIPVIMLTAKGQPSDEEACLEAGAIKFITKPFSPRELLEIVQQNIN